MRGQAGEHLAAADARRRGNGGSRRACRRGSPPQHRRAAPSADAAPAPVSPRPASRPAWRRRPGSRRRRRRPRSCSSPTAARMALQAGEGLRPFRHVLAQALEVAAAGEFQRLQLLRARAACRRRRGGDGRGGSSGGRHGDTPRRRSGHLGLRRRCRGHGGGRRWRRGCGGRRCRRCRWRGRRRCRRDRLRDRRGLCRRGGSRQGAAHDRLAGAGQASTFFCRHISASLPPGVTPEQCDMKSERQWRAARSAARW